MQIIILVQTVTKIIIQTLPLLKNEGNVQSMHLPLYVLDIIVMALDKMRRRKYNNNIITILMILTILSLLHLMDTIHGTSGMNTSMITSTVSVSRVLNHASPS